LLDPHLIVSCYHRACEADVQAFKPGNVSVANPGHGMDAKDFLDSAQVTAEVMSEQLQSAHPILGKSIYLAASATMNKVSCNTNLGIILLCFPLAHAAASCETWDGYRRSLEHVLDNADVADTQYVFDAITLMGPAGLGSRNEHDVAKPAGGKLKQIMASVAHYDLIAKQYSNNFNEVLCFGMNSISALGVDPQHLDREIEEVTAVVFLDFLATYPDTHISRKYGATMAEAVRDEARIKRNLLNAASDPEEKRKTLLQFDSALKSRGINPGTSADMTVAVMFAALLENTLRSDAGGKSRRAAESCGCR